LTSFCDRYDYHRAHGHYPEAEPAGEVETAEVSAEDTTSKVVKPKRSTPRPKTSDVAETKAAESEE